MFNCSSKRDHIQIQILVFRPSSKLHAKLEAGKTIKPFANTRRTQQTCHCIPIRHGCFEKGKTTGDGIRPNILRLPFRLQVVSPSHCHQKPPPSKYWHATNHMFQWKILRNSKNTKICYPKESQFKLKQQQKRNWQSAHSQNSQPRIKPPALQDLEFPG